MTKNWRKKLQLKKKLNFFWSKITIYLSLGLYKERPITEEAFSSQKRPSNTSKHELLIFFLLLWVIIWIRIHWPDWIRIQSGSGSATLLFTKQTNKRTDALFSFFFLIRILRGPEREPILWEDADAVVPGVHASGPGGGLPPGLPRLQALHPATLLPQVRPRLPGGSEQARQVDLDFIKNTIFLQRWLIFL